MNTKITARELIANVRKLGGKVKVKSRTANLAHIELTDSSSTFSASVMWDDVLNDPTFRDGSKNFNPQNATLSERKQWLWSRVVFTSVRLMFPDAFAA